MTTTYDRGWMDGRDSAENEYELNGFIKLPGQRTKWWAKLLYKGLLRYGHMCGMARPLPFETDVFIQEKSHEL